MRWYKSKKVKTHQQCDQFIDKNQFILLSLNRIAQSKNRIVIEPLGCLIWFYPFLTKRNNQSMKQDY